MLDAADLIREAAAHHERAAATLAASLEGDVAAQQAAVQTARDEGTKADAVLRRAGRALAGLGF